MSSKSKDNKKLVLLIVASVSVVVLIVCVVRLALYSLDSYRSEKNVDNLKEKIENDISSSSGEVSGMSGESISEEITVSKFNTLYKENRDFAGWIHIDGTKIDYPVMQTINDEEFYLHRNFYKEESAAGLPFIDCRCDIVRPSTNIIIYGHNMKSGDMFADLLKYDDKDYLEEHDTIVFDTIFRENKYKIISVFRTDVSEDSGEDFKFYTFVNASDSYSLKRYLAEVKSYSKHEIPFDPDKVVSVITLSTCEYTKKDGRYVVIAAKMSDI